MSDFSDRIERLLALTKKSKKEIKNLNPVTTFGMELGGMLAECNTNFFFVFVFSINLIFH